MNLALNRSPLAPIRNLLLSRLGPPALGGAIGEIKTLPMNHVLGLIYPGEPFRATHEPYQ